MPSLNGYGTLRETTDSAGSASIEDTAAETFITSGLTKVMKINNICDSEHLEDCGLSSTIITMEHGGKINFPKTLLELNSEMVSYSTSGALSPYSAINSKVAAFETQNGESVAVYYNPNCLYSSTSADNGLWNYRYPHNWYCANFVYDLNGKKGPNTLNKDIGVITAFFATDSLVVGPVPYSARSVDNTPEGFPKVCTKLGGEYRIPNIYEAISLYINKNLFKLNLDNGIMTSTSVYNPTTNSVVHWALHPNGGNCVYTQTEYRGSTYCVKR